MTAHSSEPTTSSEGRVELQHWSLTRLIPYARNARTHSDAQIAELAGSIRTFGFTNPMLVSEHGDVIAGHARLAAAQRLGLAEVPVIVVTGLTELKRRQLVLADNRIALNAGWDAEMLRLELQDLHSIGADLATLGFAKNELARLLSIGTKGLTDEDEVPAIAETAVSRLGDVWELGGHRIANGDSTMPAVVAALLDGAAPQLMVTDPPYGVRYDPTWRHRAGVNKSSRRGKVVNDERADWGPAWAQFPGRIAYVWHGALHSTTVAQSLQKHGFTIRSQIIWAKERLVIGRGDYHFQHEPAWYAVREKGHWTGDRKQTTLWTIPNRDQDAKTTHGTQKPVECMRRPMQNNSDPGEAVYDPFLGSGTTLIAAESSGRIALGVEIDSLYVDVAIRRWQAFAGAVAVLKGDGRSFAEIAAARQAVLKDDSPEDTVSREMSHSQNHEGSSAQTVHTGER